MKALILAAGRGSRLNTLTDSKPKCLVEIAGKPLLQWQIETLATAGIAEIAVVRGYLADTIHSGMFGLPFVELENPRWSSSNMVTSLLCATEWCAGEPTIISYSDILYHADHIAALNSSLAPIAITYDELWEPLWRLRFNDPLSDAETFRQVNGRLIEIGGKPDNIQSIRGQYMGLLKIMPAGWAILTKTFSRLSDSLDSLDMTALLRNLLSEGVNIAAVPCAGRWCEVDNCSDLEQYKTQLCSQNWAHDWR